MQSEQLKYLKVYSKLKLQIESSQDGDKLPSERNLGVEHGCSFLTVRKALNLLEAEGAVERRPGAGTFIRHTLNTPRSTLTDNKVIGILLHEQGDAYAMRLATALEQYAQECGIVLHMKFVKDFTKQSLSTVKQLQQSGCSAIAIPWYPSNQESQVKEFSKLSILPVCLPSILAGLEEKCFEAPEIFGLTAINRISTAGDYFLKLGYQSISFIVPDNATNSIIHKNIFGYIDFISRNKLTCHSYICGPNHITMDELVSRFKSLCPNLAVIAYDDAIAIRFMMCAQQTGLKAAQDYGILGCNNTSDEIISDPPLSTMPQNYGYLAKSIINHTRALAQGRSHQSKTPCPLSILARESCGGKVRLGERLNSVLNEIDTK